LLADPQLIDPHSYPDRPWPLSKFTVLHTDNYLKRSYIQLQKYLHPDTIFFLGDLFDGGREWAPGQGSNNEDPAWIADQRPKKEAAMVPQWRKKYRDDFWLKEYNRFGKIFFEYWNDGGNTPGVGQRGRKVIASLPGNHDLGFGAGIKIPVRKRFQAYFGDTNRVDIIGNHTFVSVDSVSLSAKDEEQAGVDTKAIYGPVEDFLENVQVEKRKAMARELRYQNGELAELQQEYGVIDLTMADYSHLPSLDPGDVSSSFPTILLTHVPLWRNEKTPCGPLRERWPPSKPPAGQTQPLAEDERNAIPIKRGYQYQNVLSVNDSKRLINTIGDVVSVFSGDDHDYCEVVHSDKNNVREITVKSMSWAMGVRKPGFLMLSMWNPVDSSGAPLGTHTSGHGAATPSNPLSATIETHLCLLPDQIGIFIRYAILVIITFGVLLTRAVLTPFFKLTPFASSASSDYYSSYPFLPMSSKDAHSRRDRDKEQEDQTYNSRSSNSSTSSTSSAGSANLASRTTAARTRSVSPASGTAAGGYGLPPSQARYTPPSFSPVTSNYKSPYVEDVDDEERDAFMGMQRGKSGRMDRLERRKLTKFQVIVREAGWSVFRVAWVAGCVYLWLVWYG
jgi:ethanolamine phosphate phosphodiesterase